MSKTLEQVKAEALTLPSNDRDKLIDDLIEASVNESIGQDMEQIEATVHDRLEGPFTRIDDPKAHFEERLRYHRGVLKRAHG